MKMQFMNYGKLPLASKFLLDLEDSVWPMATLLIWGHLSNLMDLEFFDYFKCSIIIELNRLLPNCRQRNAS